jgi:hypothetical protein
VVVGWFIRAGADLYGDGLYSTRVYIPIHRGCLGEPSSYARVKPSARYPGMRRGSEAARIEVA